MRKTFDVQEFRQDMNARIARSATDSDKVLLSTVLERVLMDSGNYKGFSYRNRTAEQVRDGDYDRNDRHYY